MAGYGRQDQVDQSASQDFTGGMRLEVPSPGGPGGMSLPPLPSGGMQPPEPSQWQIPQPPQWQTPQPPPGRPQPQTVLPPQYSASPALYGTRDDGSPLPRPRRSSAPGLSTQHLQSDTHHVTHDISSPRQGPQSEDIQLEVFEQDEWQARVDQENAKAGRIKDEMWKKSKDMGATVSSKYAVANFLFLCVLLGIEMDMCGMICSLQTYWDYNEVVLRVFLFFNLFAFCAPLLMAMCDEEDDKGSSEQAQGGHQHTRPRAQRKSNSLITQMTSHMRAINPFATSFKLYHFCPGIRFYLLIKKTTNMSDVTGVLKVNTLSSFTLGIYQLVGIGYTIWFDLEMNVFVQFNILSQALNWSITILYFATPIARWMGNGAQVRQIDNFYQGIRNEWSQIMAQRAEGLIEKDAEEDNKKKRRRFKDMISQTLASGILGDNPENERHRAVLLKDLEMMRDPDVPEYIDIIQGHTTSCIG